MHLLILTNSTTDSGKIDTELTQFFFQREQYRLLLSPIATVGQVTPRHRRQLRFADAEIKLKRDVVYHNLHNGHETCKSNVNAVKRSF